MDSNSIKAYHTTDLYSAIGLSLNGLPAGGYVTTDQALATERAANLQAEGHTPIIVQFNAGTSTLEATTLSDNQYLLKAVPTYNIFVEVDGAVVKLDDYLGTLGIHVFDSSGDAYDATQCDESIKTGDCLVIPSEGVVGIADTWPIALTENPGELHEPHPGCNPFEGRNVTDEQIEFGKTVSAQLNFAVADWTHQLKPAAPRSTAPGL